MLADQRAMLRGFSRPLVGQIVTWFVIYVAVVKPSITPHFAVGERESPVSVISFLPDEVLGEPTVYLACRVALACAGALWALRLLLPYSAWLTVGFFTATIALAYENSPKIAHIYNLTNIVMLAHVLWYHFYHREIRESMRRGCFWTTELYPKWVFALSVFCVAVFHTYAGVIKIWNSGLEWANGVPLQLWLTMAGKPDSWLGHLILHDRQLASLFQWGTLIVEAGAILAIFSPRLRTFVGLGLLGLYFGILESFGFRFTYNATLVALLFLPTEAILVRFGKAVRKVRSRAMHSMTWKKATY